MSRQKTVTSHSKFTETLVILFTVIFAWLSLGGANCAAAITPSANKPKHHEEWKTSSQPTPNTFNLATVYFYLGLEFYDLEQWQQAIVTFKEALKIRPDCEVTYFSLGITYSRLEFWEEALASFIKAIELKPDYAQAYLGLGIAYDMLGWGHEAIKALMKAIQVKPGYAQAHYALALSYLKLGDKASALKEHGILKTLDPNLANHLLDLINR